LGSKWGGGAVTSQIEPTLLSANEALLKPWLFVLPHHLLPHA